MKKRLLFVACLLLAAVLQANPVNEGFARMVGSAWLNAIGHPHASLLQRVETPFTEFYVFSAEGGGFVMVSADDCVRPILGYSATAPFPAGELPENVGGWLEDYSIAIRRVAERFAEIDKQGATVGNRQTEAIAEQWRQLAGGVAPEPQLLTSVTPLVTTTWNQSPYYNALCPYDSIYNAYVVTGCVATATAQIMKFWNHPTTGYGSHGYQAYNNHIDYGWLSANFGTTTYQWSTMPTALTSVSSQAEIDAVATLMYHIGIADEMSYDVSANGGSGAYNYSNDGWPRATSQFSLMSYFKYRPDMAAVARDDYDDATYSAILRAELDQNRPILYSGRNTSGGHSFVCDGYDEAGMFHINWGWGGSRDGYFYIGSLNPGVGGTGGNSTGTYNVRNVALLGIRPNTNFGSGGTVSTSTTGGTAACTVSGGGNYSFGDTVSLYATASEGYRFAGWSDNSRFNPRYMIMNGGDYSFTARYEALSALGDTMGYCSGNNLTSFGSGNDDADTYWGIRLPASSLTAGNILTAVQFYVNYAGTYDVMVYTGTTSPTDTVYTGSITITNNMTNDWFTLFLSQPYNVDPSKSIWICMHNYGVRYPAALTYGCGNLDGFLWGQNLSQLPDWNQYSLMLRGIFNVDPILASGDTISYCGNNDYQTSWGMYSNEYKWGILVPAAQLAGRNYLKSVLLFTDFSGNYTLRIYRGGENAPATLVHTQPYNATDYGWHEILLDNTISLDTASNLWVTFSAPDLRWPAAVCAYTGMANSDWYTTDGTTWNHMSNVGNMYSWMIQVVTSATAPILPAPTVTIDKQYYATLGTATTFTATSTSGTTPTWTFQGATPASATGQSATVTWSNTGYYMVTASVNNSHGTGHDTLWVQVVNCGQPFYSFPYTQSFEASENTLCFDMVDNDNDGQTWAVNPYNSYYGQRCITSAGAAAPDNWLILPKMQTSAGSHYTLRWYDNGDYGQHYGIYIDTSAGTATANYVLLNDYTINNNYWTEQSVDLSSYAGRTFRLAFRHFNNTGTGDVHLDYITLAEDFFVEGSTLSYCGSTPLAYRLGNGGSMQWGIMLPASRLIGYDTLKSVQLYVYAAGSYTLNIANGNAYAPGTTVATKTVSFGEQQLGWQTIILDSPVVVSGMQQLWITFASPVSTPCAYCDFTGDPNSNWCTINGSDWRHIDYWDFYSSWMIKANMSANNGCGVMSLPYTADFTQCWQATGGATITNSARANFTSPGQMITSPWIEVPNGVLNYRFELMRNTIGDYWWNEDSAVYYNMQIENENGVLATYNYSSQDGIGSTYNYFNANAGRIRFSFYVTNDTPHSATTMFLSSFQVYTYDMSLTLSVPGNMHVGDTVTLASHVTMEGNDVPNHREFHLYTSSWYNVDNTHCTILSHTDSSCTVVWHESGQYHISAYAEKYSPLYVSRSAYADFTVSDTVTIDCDNISLPYTADFTQCWTADGGATVIDAQTAAITSYGQTITGPWMESVQGKTFIKWSEQRTGPVDWENDRYLITIEGENGIISQWNWTPYGNNNYNNDFTSPGGRIRVSFTFIGNSSIPSLRISNVVLYQYQIAVTIDAPSIASVGDTVTYRAHYTLQNSDEPDYTDWYMYDHGNWMENNNPARTILARTDSTFTIVWHTAGTYELNCDIIKNNIYRSYYAYAHDYSNIMVTDHPLYEEDSIYYTSAAKDTVIGSHTQLHNALLPESVRVILDSAFFNRQNLATITLPDGLRHIGKMSFALNYLLTEVTLPRDLQFLGDNAFWGCESLETIHYNADSCLVVSPTTYGDNDYYPAFIECYNVKTITIGENVKCIPGRIFWGCYGLRGTLVIPDAVTYIGEEAFTGWNQNWTGEDGDTLRIILSRNLREIGNYAFAGPFGKLRTVVSRNPEPPTIYASTFYVQDATLVVPCGSKRAYNANQYWHEFQHFVENCEGIEDAEAEEVNIYAVERGIVIDGAIGEAVTIYDIMGRTVATAVNNGKAIGIAHTGTYLVKVGDMPAQRVVVVR